MQIRRHLIVLLAAMALACGFAAAGPSAARDATLWEGLARWSGWTSERLREVQEGSGMHDAEEFAVAVVVALNVGVSARALAEGGARDGLVATLRGMGISPDTARREIRLAERQVRGWRRQPPPAAPAAVPGSPDA